MKTRDIIRELSHLNIDIYEDCDITHDSLQVIIDGLDDDELDRYTDNLVQITLCDSKGVIKWTRTLLKATEEQKVEAILKAKGVWK
jgi:hypothetical protein